MKKIMMFCLVITGVTTISYAGDFESFDQKAKNGKHLTVAFLGGSLTWGANATDPQKTSYRAIMGKALQEKYPKAHFTFIDAAIGGTGAQLGVFRLKRDVLRYKPDLMFLDFTLNDCNYQVSDATLSAYESIIRQALKADCPVILMFLAAKSHVKEKDIYKMLRRTAHLRMAMHYNLPVGDAVFLMNTLFHKGKLDLDRIWPPDSFDNTHPVDAGYKLYAQAAKEAFERGVNEKMTPRLPAQWVSNPSYANVTRVKISDLGELPKGWEMTKPETNAVAFDFVMSRWLDNLVRAANNKRTGRNKYELNDTQPQPLEFRFKGSSVLLFGESKPTCGLFQVAINGKVLSQTFDGGQIGKPCKGIAHMVIRVVDDLDGSREHTMMIIPQFKVDTPLELRIESICVAGPEEVYVKPGLPDS